MGVYELLYCGLPPYALSQHVGLAKALVRPDAGRLVNGVLRSLARAQEAGQLPDPQVGQKW
jgi:16S rRNA (cytosine967-C5)-methyltransferase